MKTTFLIRTHRWDTMAADLASGLIAAGQDVIVAADESGGSVETGSVPKVTVTPRLAHPAPPQRPKDWGWLCGDLCLYAGLDARPGAERFVLMDGDVQIGEATLRRLLERLGAMTAEAAAADLATSGADKRMSRGLAAIGRAVDVGCLFPFVVASRRVADTMRRLRHDIIAHRPVLRINDEAVLATVVREMEVEAFDLREWDDLFSPGTFGVDALHIHTSRPQDGVLHPVMPFGAALRKVAGGDALTVRRLTQTEVDAHLRAALGRAGTRGGQAGADGGEAMASRVGVMIAGLPQFDGVRLSGVPADALLWLGQAWEAAVPDLSDTVGQGPVVVAARVGMSDGGRALAALTAEAEAEGLAFRALRDVVSDGSRTESAVAWFVRDRTRLDARDLSALAVIAAGAMRADDLALECLDALVADGAIAGEVREAYIAACARPVVAHVPSSESLDV